MILQRKEAVYMLSHVCFSLNSPRIIVTVSSHHYLVMSSIYNEYLLFLTDYSRDVCCYYYQAIRQLEADVLHS